MASQRFMYHCPHQPQRKSSTSSAPRQVFPPSTPKTPRHNMAHEETQDIMAESPRSIMMFEQENHYRKKQTTTQRFRIDMSDPRVEYIPNDLVRASDMTQSEKRSIWWQKADFDAFRKTGKLIASEIRRACEGRKTPLHSYAAVLRRVYSMCCIKAEDGEHDIFPPEECDLTDEQELLLFLRQWSAVGTCRRGLEKWSIPPVSVDRAERRFEAIQAVLDLQHSLRQTNHPLLPEHFPDYIREVYEESTR
mmetsp:Transcript_14814/g.34232  ORF Transcript_14814/g.34232 Transcript_14814/m.34232 type:complete len:249 (+) Transcript_14814:160-906(+)|eukprot:CAMPEP_0116855542 /NCGR_PEP_ID=MMETSP0418-20121206/19345_1 /TAXON_ID=1158023 /ORGANISM="Astrosyne radiata, Strain 13vi08-1A" /LENGTH=248 /DNA_ID=CAMNT_0004488705 /DNA_START=99 /DNA_END=845 /DNA_ORIENTATION=+